MLIVLAATVESAFFDSCCFITCLHTVVVVCVLTVLAKLRNNILKLLLNTQVFKTKERGSNQSINQSNNLTRDYRAYRITNSIKLYYYQIRYCFNPACLCKESSNLHLLIG